MSMAHMTAPHLRSLSAMCGDFHATYQTVVRAINRAGVKPTLTLDNVNYFDDAASERIRLALAVNTGRREAAANG